MTPVRKTILLFAMLIMSTNVWAQEFTVSGCLTDEAGEIVPGASIMVKRSGKAAISDVDGNFVLSGISSRDTIVVEHLSYETRRVPVNGKPVHNLILRLSAQELEAVVAIGYGTVRKSDVTSAISTVRESDIQKTAISSIEQAIQGNATGVVVINSGAEPGAEVSMSVRGASSISGETEPLVVIDNVISDNAEMTALNPEDVASMEILKDAAATAIYGARGSNGVIMITTRNGMISKPTLSVNAKIGLSFPGHTVETMTGPQYSEYADLSRYTWGTGGIITYRPDTLGTTNYNDLLIQKMALRQNYNISLRGGNSGIKYNVSAGFLDEKGILVNSGNQRLNLRGKFDIAMSKKLSLHIIAAMSNVNTQKVSKSTNAATIRMLMMDPREDYSDVESLGNGTYIDENGEVHLFNSSAALAMNSNSWTKQFITKLNAQLQWKITRSLTFNTIGSYSFKNINGYGYVPREVLYREDHLYRNEATRDAGKQSDWTLENYFNWNPKINKKNVLNMTLGQSCSQSESEGMAVSVSMFDTDYYTWDKLDAASVIGIPTSSHTKVSNMSFFTRAIYTYDKRFIATALVRADGSSRFGEDKKYGFFPAVSFAWNIKNEKSLRRVKWLNELKPRLSWGVTGNDRIGTCQSMSLLSSTKLPIGDETYNTTTTSTIGNSNLQWETTNEVNLGLDFAAFKQRLKFSVEAYYKQTGNLLYSYRVPMTSGYSTVMANVGNVENKGLEFEITGRIVDKKKFYWTSSLNMSYNQNKVLDLGGNDNVLMYYLGANVNQNITYLKIGQPVGVIMGYQTELYRDWNDVYSEDAVWMEESSVIPTRPGMLKYVDQNKDGRIDESDKVVLGSTLPPFVGGFTNTFGYKGFTLTVFFNWQLGGKIVNANCSKLMQFAGVYNNSYSILVDSYRGANPVLGDPGYTSAFYPTPSSYSASQSISRQYSQNMIDKWVFDASYLRLKSVSLTYDLPQKYSRKIGMEGLRIGITGTNLWTLTSYPGYDPEMSSSMGTVKAKMGIDYGSYPLAKTVLLSIGLTF